MWSGDGRRQVANPMMPVFNAHGSQPGSSRGGSHPSHAPTGRVQPPQALPVSGDGRGSVELSSELTMQVNAEPKQATLPAPKLKKQRSAKHKVERRAEHRSERSETWKLVTLVVIFLIWISTASTLLFLYMDRYLFP